MPPHGTATTGRADPGLPPDLRDALFGELRALAGPLAACTRTTLAALSPDETCWLAAHSACECSQSGGPPVCRNGARASGRELHAFTLSSAGGAQAEFAVCCEAAFRPATETLHRAAESALRRIDGEHEPKSIHAQPRTSGDSLEAFYEFSAELRKIQDVQELLQRILAKTLALQDGLHAVLWLKHDEQLEAVVPRGAAPVPPRRLQDSLLRRALAANEILTLKRGEWRAESRESEAHGSSGSPLAAEPELARATAVAVLPIVTRQGVLGALEAWQEQGENVFTPRLLRWLEALAFLAAIVVENDRLHRYSLERERLQHDVEIASRIQQTLLLGQAPLDVPSLRAAALTIPSLKIDGDFYDFHPHRQGLDVILADVMGKGIPAALVGAATKHHFLRAANALLATRQGQLPGLSEVLTIVNEELVKQLIGVESFVTLVYARFDVKRRQLVFVDCGHTRTIHIHGRGGDCTLLQGGNMPLGFSQDDVYEPVAVPFSAGDVFFFYSDGITEARNPAGAFFGEARLAELIQANYHLPPDELLEVVRREVNGFSGADKYSDDLTCVAVQIMDARTDLAVLEITSDLRELPRMRAFLREICGRNVDLADIPEVMAQIELAATEAVSNIMIHAFGREPDHPIRLEAQVDAGRLRVRVTHRGKPFDPDKVEKVNLDTPRENRMGLHIIRECMENVRYFVTEQGENALEMAKRLQPQPQ